MKGRVFALKGETYVLGDYFRDHLESKKKKLKNNSYDLFITVTNSQNKFCWVWTEEKARMLNDF